jgi:hypothetical protein
MKLRSLFIAISASALMAGCSSGDASQLTDLQTQLSEQKAALTDTITYYTNMISDLQGQVDSLSAALTALSTPASTSSSKKPSPPPPPKPDGQIDVTKKGGGDAPKIDVTKKGAGDAPKIDVTKKGGGN